MGSSFRNRIGPPAVTGLMVGIMVAFVVAPLKMAYAVSCDEWGTGFGAKVDSKKHFGTSGTGSVVSVTSSCILVRSLYIRIDMDNAAEIGWYQDGANQSVYKCDDVTTPHVFVWARTAGYNKCKSGTAAVTGPAAYRLENPAHDNTIEYYYNGQYQGFFSVAFRQGESWSYSEHHVAGDDLVADWSSLRYLGNAGNWNLWPTIYHWTAGDTSGFKRCAYSSTHWAVKRTSDTC